MTHSLRTAVFLALGAFALGACGGDREPTAREVASYPRGNGPDPADLKPDGRWTIRLRTVAPRSAGTMRFEAGPLRAAGNGGAKHDLRFVNTGDRPVAFADTRTSRLLGGGGHHEPLAADAGCGYAQDAPGAKIEAGACRDNLDEFVVEPGATVRRTITLFWDLPGAGRLTAGRYAFDRRVRFAAGRRAPGTRPNQIVRLIYDFAE